jgi:cell division protein ZapA (FtsZ GTPase activity inhibitor)
LDRQKKSARVAILGLELRVKTDTDSAYVEEIARYVESRVKESSAEGAPPTAGVALLTAMNIADDLYKLRRDAEGERRERDRRIEGLLKRVETALDA